MSHTSTYRSTIGRVHREILARTLALMGRAVGVRVVEQVSGYGGRGGVFDYAVRPVGQGCLLGLGIRVGADGSLEFGEDTWDRQYLGEFLDQQRQVFLKTYTSALLLEAAALCGYRPEVLHEGLPGEPNRIALTVAL